MSSNGRIRIERTKATEVCDGCRKRTHLPVIVTLPGAGAAPPRFRLCSACDNLIEALRRRLINEDLDSVEGS